ncbi:MULTISPECIES: hypothetical protein [Bradyrhizobium]
MDRVIQYAAASRLEHKLLWSTDRPVEPGDDGVLCGDKGAGLRFPDHAYRLRWRASANGG